MRSSPAEPSSRAANVSAADAKAMPTHRRRAVAAVSAAPVSMISLALWALAAAVLLFAGFASAAADAHALRADAIARPGEAASTTTGVAWKDAWTAEDVIVSAAAAPVAAAAYAWEDVVAEPDTISSRVEAQPVRPTTVPAASLTSPVMSLASTLHARLGLAAVIPREHLQFVAAPLLALLVVVPALLALRWIRSRRTRAAVLARPRDASFRVRALKGKAKGKKRSSGSASSTPRAVPADFVEDTFERMDSGFLDDDVDSVTGAGASSALAKRASPRVSPAPSPLSSPTFESDLDIMLDVIDFAGARPPPIPVTDAAMLAPAAHVPPALLSRRSSDSSKFAAIHLLPAAAPCCDASTPPSATSAAADVPATPNASAILLEPRKTCSTPCDAALLRHLSSADLFDFDAGKERMVAATLPPVPAPAVPTAPSVPPRSVVAQIRDSVRALVKAQQLEVTFAEPTAAAAAPAPSCLPKFPAEYYAVDASAWPVIRAHVAELVEDWIAATDPDSASKQYAWMRRYAPFSRVEGGAGDARQVFHVRDMETGRDLVAHYEPATSWADAVAWAKVPSASTSNPAAARALLATVGLTRVRPHAVLHVTRLYDATPAQLRQWHGEPVDDREHGPSWEPATERVVWAVLRDLAPYLRDLAVRDPRTRAHMDVVQVPSATGNGVAFAIRRMWTRSGGRPGATHAPQLLHRALLRDVVAPLVCAAAPDPRSPVFWAACKARGFSRHLVAALRVLEGTRDPVVALRAVAAECAHVVPMLAYAAAADKLDAVLALPPLTDRPLLQGGRARDEGAGGDNSAAAITPFPRRRPCACMDADREAACMRHVKLAHCFAVFRRRRENRRERARRGVGAPVAASAPASPEALPASMAGPLVHCLPGFRRFEGFGGGSPYAQWVAAHGRAPWNDWTSV
ncbi:hypothetical protein H9P43_009870 [Blastocladiella emersonii ATCC 22665]|nr:hypothetical protein H9P43_009870 [Blastocladiella emersonii ATCC 22665]